MKCNMGTLDRLTRIAAGAVFLGIAAANAFNPPLIALGAVAVFTGAIGICPAYLPFGFDTLEDEATPAHANAKANKAA